MDLVTLAEAREHLRLDADSSGGADDAWLAMFIPAASEAVLSWLKVADRAYRPAVDSAGGVIYDSAGDPVPMLDSAGDPVVRYVVKAAVLIELASMYRYREGEGTENAVTPDAGYGYVLNKASTALLSPLRRPTLA